jgi:hypothetical protein
VVGDGSGELQILLKPADAAQRTAVILPIDSTLELRLDIATRLYLRLRGKRIGLVPRALRLTPLQKTG